MSINSTLSKIDAVNSRLTDSDCLALTHDPAVLRSRAKAMRRHVLLMAKIVGQGYVGQGLGIADVLAVIYFSQLRSRPNEPYWPDRDRFVLSIGHYAIGLYAALAEAGIIPIAELDTYGADESRLEMSAPETTPGVEMTGGSLGHGLVQSVGMALGLRLRNCEARVFILLSDGECQEGSTWEGAMAASHHRLDHLTAIIDCNNQQADGPPACVMGIEPLEKKWSAFGWHTQRVNGNDIQALLAAFAKARETKRVPQAIIVDTLMGCGVRIFEEREKNHFIRVEADEWELASRQLDESR
ncbi:MAG TPA: transketolase [Gemmataceae bacterium]|nr:transketolase [Gemmataceae bacterium]